MYYLCVVPPRESQLNAPTVAPKDPESFDVHALLDKYAARNINIVLLKPMALLLKFATKGSTKCVRGS